LDVASLRRAYRDGAVKPAEVVDTVLAAIGSEGTEGIWIRLRDAEDLRADARRLEERYPRDARPALYGVPFAVKDNIDVAGVPTTVACAEFAHVPEHSAPVVDRLRALGALFVGKTNLDQFATGLVGVRSPYGVPKNPFDARYVTGGSSSGSAAAVARGQVSFALATDTAGSGRVPAAFNNLVGLKPSRGLLSTRGLVPACRSIDCMTFLTLTCDDAKELAMASTGFDASDPYSRHEAARFQWQSSLSSLADVRIGVPRDEDLIFGDAFERERFVSACARMETLGTTLERVDMTPFYEAGALLYGGPWVAERLSGLETFIEAHPEAILPVIRSILDGGTRHRATDAFRAVHRLAELRRAVEPLWSRVEALLVPTAPYHPRIEEVLADPIEVNARLGRYTTFANLLDLAAVAVPGGFRPNGLPSGVTFIGPWGRDAALLAMASAFHATTGGSLGATEWPLPRPAAPSFAAPEKHLSLAVVGAHLSGFPLNHQLTDRGGRLARTAWTAPHYRLYALPGTRPPKPGLVRATGEGARIELEVWTLPMETIGSFLAGIGSPLALGTIELDDGSRVHGFLCEAHAVKEAEDISSFGGWRSYERRVSG
jgi:allophanate hydrolase